MICPHVICATACCTNCSSVYSKANLAYILKMAADSAALKAVKNKPVRRAYSKGEKNYLKFTRQELENISEATRVLIVYNGNAVTYRFHNGSYGVRFNRDGYHIEVYASDLKILRAKFLDKVATYQPKPKEDKSCPYMKDFVPEWLKAKSLTVKETTLKSYEDLISVHVIPPFGDMRLNVITRSDIQDYLSELVNTERYRTAQKLRQLLSAIFDVAAEDFGIKSPMTKIQLAHYEVKKGNALTKAEEKILVDYCIAHKNYSAASALLVLLYTGMRIGELKTAVAISFYGHYENKNVRQEKSV